MFGVAAVLAGFSLVTALLAWSRWLAHRRLAAAGHVLMALAAGWGAVTLWPMLSNLESYEPAVRGRPIAELYFEQTGSRSYRAMLTHLPQGRIQVFEMMGDQWRLEARTLDWRGWVADLGMRPVLRLERLSARHTRPLTPGDPPASNFPLDADEGEDVWAQARTGPGWTRHAVAGMVQGPWQNMAHAARFVVRLGAGCLEVEPANEAAAVAAAPAR